MKIKNEETSKYKGLKIFFYMILISTLGCILSFIVIVFGHEIYGSSVERIIRYPNSNLIWSGYGYYGSSDYGSKVYYRWSADPIDDVQQYYVNFPISLQPSIIEVNRFDPQSTWVCSWLGFSRAEYENGNRTSRNIGCETLNNQLPSYGTIISFGHSYFSG